MRRVSAKFDNAPCHTSLLVRQLLSNKNIMVCPHPPYSPDMAPYDFQLFSKVKIIMKDKRFESIHDIEAATTAQLKTLTKEDFQNCFRKWQERWDKCVRSEGECFEGINGNVSFTVIIFLFKHSPYFLNTPRILIEFVSSQLNQLSLLIVYCSMFRPTQSSSVNV